MTRLILVVLFMVLATGAVAQDCTIAAYGNAAGTQSHLHPMEGRSNSIFVVMRAEATVAAAAYAIEIPGLHRTLFLQARYSGPTGRGLSIDEPTGTNVALAECVIGFGGNPVLVDEYVLLPIPGFTGGAVSVHANASQSPYSPRYVTCNDVTLECEIGPDLIFDSIIPTDAKSFGAVKSLYR